MATPLNSKVIEKIECNRNKDKAVVVGFFYSLNRTSGGVPYWVCELHGKCNARIKGRNDNIIKPADFSQSIHDHTHAPSRVLIEMLQSYSK